MPAPRDPGFTGVDWYSRPTEKLAGDLLGGAGARPLHAAAQETARLASAYGAAAVRLDRLLDRLDGALENGRPETRRTGPLPDYARWLARHAADLAEYAAKLASQAAAYGTAARAMPSVADAERLRTDRESTRAAAAAGGADPASAALVGAAADSERAEQQTHGQAATVMVGFERAAEPLRVPWEFTPAPKSAAARNEKKPKENGRGAGGTGAGRGTGGVGVPAAPLGAYAAATAPQRDQAGAPRASASAQSAGSGSRGFPMMPAGMMGAAAGAAGSRNAAQHDGGAVASEAADDLPDAFVVHTAPAVFGAHADALVGEEA
ncbi:PPE domain-containing protein [Tsukamurella sp. 1534]|uniref:PPE domain-containing protein n=1 Tax=Tsukamurella sp. 1534 TaxID=1151061 RepID=UPI0002FC48CF|nr:PPE domain-containing protein [Tsukamurella sp. 1534]